MNFLSTRNSEHLASLSEALLAGLAPDGGLYVPDQFPSFDVRSFPKKGGIQAIAHYLLEPFFAGDPLAEELPEICEETFGFDIPLQDIGNDTSVLELFHGPTAAFKDVGAGFLASCMSRLNKGAKRSRTVL